MERQTDLAEAIDVVADKAQYDRCAKKLLAFKAIDAWILGNHGDRNGGHLTGCGGLISVPVAQ